MIERLIEKVEGEARLQIRTDGKGRIVRARVLFPHFRGMEKILERREALDATVLTPRVCGICGHAHLMAAVEALEGCYAAADRPLTISPKAKTIRAATLALEMVQNHLKWFYLTLPQGLQELAPHRSAWMLAAHGAATRCARAIALLAGQWPHTSYALPGGVMCDPTHMEILQFLRLIDEVRTIFRNRLFDDPEGLIYGDDYELILKGRGDLTTLLKALEGRKWFDAGRGVDRFLVLAPHLLGSAGRAHRTRLLGVDPALVEEEPMPREGALDYARRVRYKGLAYETGPLARAMVAKVPMIRRLHRRYKDALGVRVIARMQEAAALLERVAEKIRDLALDEPSWIAPPCDLAELGTIDAYGAVEAARGSLLHRLRLRNGRILRYCIITPTQWNLAESDDAPGVAGTAMVGLDDMALAETVFRAFDVCAVCTTQ